MSCNYACSLLSFRAMARPRRRLSRHESWQCAAGHRDGWAGSRGVADVLSQPLQPAACPAPMIENRQGEMRRPLPIRLCQQITPPHAIAPHRAWDAMLELSSHGIDQALVFATHVRDIRLAHGHLFPGFPSSIEMMRNGSTARCGRRAFNRMTSVRTHFGLGQARNR